MVDSKVVGPEWKETRCFPGDKCDSRFQGQHSSGIVGIYLLQLELEATISTQGCHTSVTRVVFSFLTMQSSRPICSHDTPFHPRDSVLIGVSPGLEVWFVGTIPAPAIGLNGVLFLSHFPNAGGRRKQQGVGRVVDPDLPKIARWLHFLIS